MRTPSTDWNKWRYLIVDGDDDFRAWSEGVLHKVGATKVHSAASCKDGLVVQEKLHADVVLIDFQLSDLHPVDFMRRVRNLQEEGRAETLIIPVTAAADAAILRQACLVGIQSFIRKPMDGDNFLKRVEGALVNPRRFVFGRRYFGPERRLTQTAYSGAERRRPTTKPGAPLKPPRAAGEEISAAPAAPPPVKKSAQPATPAAPPRTEEPESVDAPDAPVVDDEITLIADADVAAVVDDLSPVVKQAVEGHLTWLRTGGQEGERASLQGAELHGARLGQINLSNINLREADLSDADCTGINFQGADLRQANLSHANITSGNLGVAKLRHSTLKNTRLDGASLRGADLAGANFEGASLRETDFTGANLLSTDFAGTDLSRSKGLSQGQFNKATADTATRLPGGLLLPPKNEPCLSA